MISSSADLAAAKSTDLLALIGRYTILKKISAHQWAGRCPKCGGRDRFNIDPGKGWFCRQCTGAPGDGEGHWNDAIDFIQWYFGYDFRRAKLYLLGQAEIAPIELDRWVQDRQRIETERKAQDAADMQRARDELRAERAWEIFYRNLDVYPVGRELWHARGLSDSWIDHYRVGYCPDKAFLHDGREFHSASLTIPYWRQEGDLLECIGLRHRLLSDKAPGGKYRPHLAGLGNHLFYTDPMTRGFYGDVLAVEGEVKAMVTWAIMWDEHDEIVNSNLWVVGIPGKSWKPEYLEALAGADRVFICLDPDAGKEARHIVYELGKRGRLIELPGKIDDLILQGVIDMQMMMDLIR